MRSGWILRLDRKASEISLNIDLSARPDTAMAKSLGTFQRQRSRFEGLCQKAPVALWASFPMAKELRDALSRAFDEQLKGGLKKADSEDQKKVFARFGDLIKIHPESAGIRPPALAFHQSKKAGQAEPGLALFTFPAMRASRTAADAERLVREAIPRRSSPKKE